MERGGKNILITLACAGTKSFRPMLASLVEDNKALGVLGFSTTNPETLTQVLHYSELLISCNRHKF